MPVYETKKYEDEGRINVSFIIAVAIVVVSIIWVASGMISKKKEATIIHAETQKARVKVSHRIADFAAPILSVKGTTFADKSVEIKSETAGKIEKIYIREGSKVKKGDLIASIKIDNRYASLEKSKALVTQRELEYKVAQTLESKGFNSKVRLAEAKAELEEAKSDLTNIELDITHTKINAPFDGIFDSRQVETGDYVSVGSTIGKVINLNPIKIKAEVSEFAVTKISKGATDKVRLLNGDEFDAKISYVSLSASSDTRTFGIELKAENPDNKIVEGMTAEVSLSLEPQLAYEISPAILSLNEKGDIGVKTVDENNIVKFYQVEIVRHDEKGMWVSGLPKVATLIILGQDFVKEGETVIPVDEFSEAEAELKAQGE